MSDVRFDDPQSAGADPAQPHTTRTAIGAPQDLPPFATPLSDCSRSKAAPLGSAGTTPTRSTGRSSGYPRRARRRGDDRGHPDRDHPDRSVRETHRSSGFIQAGPGAPADDASTAMAPLRSRQHRDWATLTDPPWIY